MKYELSEMELESVVGGKRNKKTATTGQTQGQMGNQVRLPSQPGMTPGSFVPTNTIVPQGTILPSTVRPA
jgi:hypothetical protein